jgi:thioredoxin-dependent peroxiredoxin
MPIPNVGDRAPDFQLQDHGGNTVSLSKLAGRHVVLYFYPKDDTPGCTKEACSFRDEYSALQAAGAVVLGVSTDDVKRHDKFARKYSLPFPLLADTEHQVAEAYGVWGEKSLYGRKFMGVTRSTFLIGPQGKVSHVWPKVKPENHAQEVLAILQGGGGGGGGDEAPEGAESTAPAEKKAPAGRKVAAKKGAARKVSARKGTAKKAPARKVAGRKTTAPKVAAKKTKARKPAAKKAAARSKRQTRR